MKKTKKVVNEVYTDHERKLSKSAPKITSPTMNFIKYLFSGSLLLFTLFFNAGFIFYFYELLFDLESFYTLGGTILGTVTVLLVYGMYWAYCIKTFKDQK